MSVCSSKTNQGWIKLYRQSLDSRVWKNPNLWQLWCYCLLRANHKPAWVLVTTGRGETEVFVETGQFVFGSKSAAKALRAKWQTTYKRLKKLEMMGNVKTQSKTHFTIVTICNWDTYQNMENIDESQKENSSKTQGKTKEKPSKTNKNEEECLKNEEKYKYSAIDLELSKLLFTLILQNKPNHPEPNFEMWSNEVRKLREIDKKTTEQIKAAIQWSQADGFWWDKVLSTASLRKKSKTDGIRRIDRLLMEMRKEKNGRKIVGSDRDFASQRSSIGTSVEM